MPGFNDNLSGIWNSFFAQRTRQLWDRFPGYHRAVVVETNDPLNMHRVRFKCPELHNWDLKPEECPWAVSAHDMGGRRAGRWSHPIIDDWIWVTFEKGHPYGPIWVGFCDPTRRKLYAYPSIFQRSPLAVNEEGDADEAPEDFDEDYLPKDGRPMSHGWQDRYGNLDIHRSVGFFPEEHEEAPPDADYDAISQSEFKQKKKAPEKNNPDAKYMARVTKYGHILLQGDQGYDWEAEFKGSFEDDEEWETKRWKYVQRLLNEDEPSETDQRRMMLLTRYGHLIEARDVGWNKTRIGEYDEQEQYTIGVKDDIDQRWIKIRTKGGMLFQSSDIGFDNEEDNRVKKLLIDEVGPKSEKEDEYWADKDARWIRIVGRHGYKIVIDERGTHTKESESKTLPHGNGILLKGRRAGSAQGQQLDSDGSGFWWEFNENDAANWSSWGSPLGQVAFINDKVQYMMMCTRLSNFGKSFKGLEENEFLLDSPTSKSAEDNTYHMKLDLDNEYLRLKTRANKGDGPMMPAADGCHTPAPRPINPSGLDEQKDINQGLEAHDGDKGDGPWVELVDAKNRGLWFSYKMNLVILRAREDEDDPKMISLSFEDQKNETLLRNDEQGGKLQIRCKGDIDIVSTEGDINIQAANKINLKAGSDICMLGGGTSLVVNNQLVGTNRDIHAVNGRMFFPGVFPGPGTGGASPQTCTIDEIEEIQLDQTSPTDRAKHYNDDFDTSVDSNQIEHPFSFRDPCVDDGREEDEE